ncbi:unnamed protein product [Oncorhynchus mykiss]|uniref:DH domain-containing protein n=1 Tax=Oncorhynchus mykiss TaxID=8022 RepID=A0A060Y6J0_ONCMY|nr:unnamed protein product [Oncorhynchus mykiss]
MDNLDAVRGLSPRSPPPEDSVSLSSSSTDIINLEDGHYSALLAELEADAQDLEGESWSVSVDQQYIKRLHKDAIKRQDVIYELIQTELYHMRTLKLLLSVYQYELRCNLQMEETRLDRMFPQMDSLLHIHQHFLWCLRDCRDGQNHYTVTQLGAILINQFSGEMGERMKESYGDCCSHHTDAVSFYKEQLQNNKKFQNLITKIGRLSIVRQLGVPECILLVTQRLAKYPFLVERILQNTDADSEEHDALAQALVLIRETISAVDSQVHDYERASWLRDIGRSLEPHSRGRLKDGRVLKREDLAVGSRNLLHEGTVNWQAANRWLKGDLKRNTSSSESSVHEPKVYSYSEVLGQQGESYHQSCVMPTVKHPETIHVWGCFSAKGVGSLTISPKNTAMNKEWYQHILREQLLPTIQEQFGDEQCLFQHVGAPCHKEKVLCMKDAQIMQSLTEKLRMFADMAEAVTGLEDVANHSRLLLRSDDLDPQQGETLLKGAITEGKFITNLFKECEMFVGLLARTHFFSSAHDFSMGLRLGLCDGHSNTLILLSLSHFATTLEVCLGSLSIWKTHLRPSFNFLTDVLRCCFNISTYISILMIFCEVYQTLLQQSTPQHDAATPVLHDERGTFKRLEIAPKDELDLWRSWLISFDC